MFVTQMQGSQMFGDSGWFYKMLEATFGHS
jgi:hypothetical protein